MDNQMNNISFSKKSAKLVCISFLIALDKKCYSYSLYIIDYFTLLIVRQYALFACLSQGKL